jgi:hypothetical protein
MTASGTSLAPREREVWLGPASRPIYGWLTTPADGTACGGVLLAPPVGREARAARRALRRLATTLAARGFVSLRIDYVGTGDSAGGLSEEDLDRAWADSVASGIELLRSCELASISAVGMRIGATVLGAAVDGADLGLAGLVLWDPCESGRNYLRELGALEALRRDHVDTEEDGAVETAEFVFPARAAGELRRLRLQSTARRPVARRLLVLVRSDRIVSDKLRSRLDEEHVEWASAIDQGAMLDVDPLHASLPDTSIRRVAEWLAADVGPRTAFKEPPDARDLAVVDVGGTSVREHAVRLGPNELFGIVSEPLATSPGPRGPLVVFLNVSNEEHTGPSRLWVELARRWAASGLTCVRFDLRGLGDSPRSPLEPEPQMYDQRWLADMGDVARALRPDDPSDTVFVGLCSGAYLALEGGLDLRARGVCVINPPVGIDFLYGVSRLAASPSGMSRGVATQLKEVALRLRWLGVVLGMLGRYVLPSAFGVDVLNRVAGNGTDLYVLASTDDLTPTAGTRRFDRFFSRRLVAPKGYRVHFVDGLDHSMHASLGRRRAIEMLDRFVLDHYAGAVTAPDDHKESR